MPTVKDLLKIKGNQVWTIFQSATVRAALVIMTEKNVGALVVVENESVVGIFSERDYASGAAEEGEFSLDTPVQKLMSSPVYGVTLNETVDNCITLMTEKHFRHLPVIDNGNLVGIISIGDLVKQSLSEKEKAIKDLEDYIWVHMI
jgi:CBS domain-containing protein